MANKMPRPAHTYRGARRNDWRKTKLPWSMFRIEAPKRRKERKHAK